MSNFPLVPREVVEQASALDIHLQSQNALLVNKDSRIWMDSLKVFGVDLSKNLVALEGGEQMSEVQGPTAAAILTDCYIAGVNEESRFDFSVIVALDAATKGKLTTNITEVNSGKAAADNAQVTIGTTNSKQESKEDAPDAWGIAIDLSDCVLVPITGQGNVSTTPEQNVGASLPEGYALYRIEFSGYKIDHNSFNKRSFPVEHELSSEKGEYPINFVAAGA